MTDIEQKALELVNEVSGSGSWTLTSLSHPYNRLVFRSLCKAIEQHEAFRQEVSDAVADLLKWPSIKQQPIIVSNLSRFIIAKPDPLVEAWIEATGNTVGMGPLNEALAKRGGKIVWEDEQ